MSKHRANVASGLVSARNASVSTQNKQLAMPDRDTLKTQSWVMRHDNTWKLNREPRQDIQVSRLSQDRDMKKNMSRDSLETRHVYRDSVTAMSSPTTSTHASPPITVLAVLLQVIPLLLVVCRRCVGCSYWMWRSSCGSWPGICTDVAGLPKQLHQQPDVQMVHLSSHGTKHINSLHRSKRWRTHGSCIFLFLFQCCLVCYALTPLVGRPGGHPACRKPAKVTLDTSLTEMFGVGITIRKQRTFV